MNLTFQEQFHCGFYLPAVGCESHITSPTLKNTVSIIQYFCVLASLTCIAYFRAVRGFPKMLQSYLKYKITLSKYPSPSTLLP